MSKQQAINKVVRYKTSNQEEEKVKQKIIEFMLGNDHCFDASHPPHRGKEPSSEWGHITGSAWLLSPNKKQVLLTHHKKLNKWLQLGGHSDGESNVLLTALREAQEESGIQGVSSLSGEVFDIDVHTFPKKKNVEEHLHYDLRFILISETTNFLISNESHNLKWVDLSAIKEGPFEESLVRMAKKTQDWINS